VRSQTLMNGHDHENGCGCAISRVLSRIFGCAWDIPQGATALWIAASYGHADVVRCLLKAGSTIDSRAGDGSTPFYMACRRNNIEVVKAFLENSTWPDVNARSDRDNGASPLYVICDANHIDLLRLLLDYRQNRKLPLDLEAANFNNATGLYIASQMGYIDAVNMLISAGAKVEARRSSGATPLIIASIFGQVPVVEALIRSGANVNACAYDGMSPLFGAVSKDNGDVVEILLAHGAEVTEDLRILSKQRNFHRIHEMLLVESHKDALHPPKI